LNASRIAAVVVHHRSYDTLPATIASLLAEGLSPSTLLVVDNSEQPSHAEQLKSSLPEGVEFLFCANAGYGAAVNLGVAWHAKNTTDAKYLLVSTHEARPEPGALRILASTLADRDNAAVVGPALVTGADSELVWSLGGYFSRILGLPRHKGHKSPRSKLNGAESHAVPWLDGAFLLFRKSVIERHPIDETFFLYMEETDHQQLLRRLGWEVILEPGAVVWQSSGGTPAFFQTRNIQLFQAKNGTGLQRIVSAPYVLATSMARDVIKRRGTSQWAPLVAGWRAGMSFRPALQADGQSKIVIINPLGAALAHYTVALAEMLRASGSEVEVQSINEPSVAGSSRLRWVFDYLRRLSKASQRRPGNRTTQTLVTWPVVGFLDLAVAKLVCGRSTVIVYHDPKPLVRSIGSGRLIARMVSAIPNLPGVIVHSLAAAEAMRKFGLGQSLEVLAHPMLRPNGRNETGSHPQKARPVVRVLGQFKQDRDFDALKAIASELDDCALEIVGRGWPTVAGWSVDARFVSEEEMDDLIRSSDVIVIPYKRFYQSGIAIRALEAGTPIVGRAASSLADMYGADSSLLVSESHSAESTEPDPWTSAVRHAIRNGAGEAQAAANKFFDAAVSDWRTWISESVADRKRTRR
jgi:GT2 family glycosyltransferase/glycosyltransferase involved in cell wall biosynthesis